MEENSSADEFDLDITEAANITAPNLIPETSRKKYENSYNSFMEWCKENQINSYSENVILAYFGMISKNFKASTLWSTYSILRTMLNVNQNIDINDYKKLKAFLKQRSDGYRPKKSKSFSPQDINRFITEASDREYLFEKVVLALGIMGACRRDELYSMKTSYINDLGSAALIEIPKTKTKVSKKFTLTGNFYQILKKYADLRPKEIDTPWFFLNYQKGKCTVQRVGINKLGSVGKKIAKCLKLPNPELFTGHCFRRSSATILIDTGEDIPSLKRHGGWRPSAIADAVSYMDESLKNKYDTNKQANKPSNSTGNQAGCSSPILNVKNVEHTQNLNMYDNCPKIVISNCTNCTFNFIR